MHRKTSEKYIANRPMKRITPGTTYVKVINAVVQESVRAKIAFRRYVVDSRKDKIFLVYDYYYYCCCYPAFPLGEVLQPLDGERGFFACAFSVAGFSFFFSLSFFLSFAFPRVPPPRRKSPSEAGENSSDSVMPN